MNPPEMEKNFFGRTDVLEILKKRVLGLKEGYRQNLAVLGSPFSGKSTLLCHFVYHLEDPATTVIYLDLENKDFTYFAQKFTGSILYNYAKAQGAPLHDDIQLLLETNKALIPQTCQVIKKIHEDLQRNKLTESFLGLLTLPEIYTNETDKFCVLILDEFQNLEDLVGANVFQVLGKKIMTQKRCLYMVASSYPEAAKKILSERLSLLFGNFDMIFLEPFDLSQSQKFIESNLKGIKLGIQLRNFLADFTGGHPLYLNLICRELTNLSAIHQQREVYLPLLSQAIENTIFDKWGVISRHFDLLIKDITSGKGNAVNSAVLMALANGSHKIEDLLASLDIKRYLLKQKLRNLADREVVAKNGNFYSFRDKMFKYWIKYVYQKRLKDVELAPDKQRRQFKEEFQRAVEAFKISSRQDFSTRIIELLHCFDNDAFFLNDRKYKLPAFVEVETVQLKNESGKSFDVLKARANDTLWYIALKKDNSAEPDVRIMKEAAKKEKEKPDRCLIIAFSELDEHTRLKALQERFWIWNEGEINTLLNLFEKPYIVR